jgi:hypothetical protein
MYSLCFLLLEKIVVSLHFKMKDKEHAWGWPSMAIPKPPSGMDDGRGAIRLAPDVIHDNSPVSQMLRLPMSVVILNFLIHPTQHRTNLCRIMTAVSHNRVNGVPEAMGS